MLTTLVPKEQPKKPQRVETIGDRVGQARRRLAVAMEQDILPSDLAKMIDVPASTISRIENDERRPGEGLIVKLAEALRVTPAWLRYGAAAVAPLPTERVYPPLPASALRKVAEAEPPSSQKKGGSR